jgi:hypothetical protein
MLQGPQGGGGCAAAAARTSACKRRSLDSKENGWVSGRANHRKDPASLPFRSPNKPSLRELCAYQSCIQNKLSSKKYWSNAQRTATAADQCHTSGHYSSGQMYTPPDRRDGPHRGATTARRTGPGPYAKMITRRGRYGATSSSISASCFPVRPASAKVFPPCSCAVKTRRGNLQSKGEGSIQA